MPNVKKNKCPWWNETVGLSQYVSSLSRLSNLNNDTLDLSFWPLKGTSDVHEIVKSGGNRISNLSFRGCHHLTDEEIKGLAEAWGQRQGGTFRDSRSIIKQYIDADARLRGHFNQNLYQLDISGCYQLTDDACNHIGLFTRLEVLDISECVKVGNRGVQYLMDGCKYLQEVSLENLFRVQDEGLLYIKRNLVMMKMIRKMNFSGCTGLSNEAIMNFLESDPLPGIIRSIDLSNTNTELGMMGLNRNFLGSTSNCKVIKLRSMPRILDSTFAWIASGCKDLQYLDISGNRAISDYCLSYLFQGCKSLRSIDMSDCCDLTDEAFECFAPTIGGQMKEIFLTNCHKLTTKSIVKISTACHGLVRLFLQGVSKVNSDAIISVAHNCRALQALVLSTKSLGNSKTSSIPRVGKKGIIALGRYCPDLRLLHCDCCSRIDDIAIIALAKGCKKLEELSIRRCYKVTDKSLGILGKYCARLRIFRLSSCREITDVGVSELCFGCRLLEEIDLSNLRLSDVAILNISRHSVHLKVVVLRNCYHLTDLSLNALLMSCKYIETVDVQSVDLVTDSAFCEGSLNRLRKGNFSGTNISEFQAVTMAKRSWYCDKENGRLTLKPLYTSKQEHRQHQKYILFLCRARTICYCAIRRYIINARIRARLYKKDEASRKIQQVFKNYFNCIKRRKQIILDEQKSSIEVIKAFLRGKVERGAFLKLRVSTIVVQISFRRYQKRKKIKKALKMKEKLDKYYTEIAQSKMDYVYNEIALSLWRRVLIRLFAMDSITYKTCAKRIQRVWRDAISLRRNQKQVRLKTGFALWCRTFVEHVMKIRFQAVCKIQQQWRLHKKLSSLRKSLYEREVELFLRSNRMKIANFAQGRWRRMQFRRILAIKRDAEIRRLVLNDTAVKIQCWYRRISSYCRALAKRRVVQIWGETVGRYIFQVRASSATFIQTYFHYWNFKRQRKVASHVIVRNILIWDSKRRKRKKILIESRFHAIISLQPWIRGSLCRKRLAMEAAAALKIQNMCRFAVARSRFRKLVKEEHIRVKRESAMKKEKLYMNRIERQIIVLFAKTESGAARKIQQCYREHLDWMKEEKKRKNSEDRAQMKRMQETERLNQILKKKQESRQLKNIAQKYVRSIVHNVTIGVSNFTSLKAISDFKGRRRKKFERREIASELLKVRAFSEKARRRSLCSSSNSLIYRHSQFLRSLYGTRQWFDDECEQLMLRFLLWPEDINLFRGLWTNTLDFKKEESVSSCDLFDHVSEPKTAYALWLLEGSGLKREDEFNLSFSKYFTVVCYCAMLSKSDLLELLFTSAIQASGRDHMTKDEWVGLVGIMLDKEKIRYPKRMAHNAYEKFASRDVHSEHVLYYSDFLQMVQQFCPFLLTPILRFHSSVRTSHCGESFWRSKAREIQHAEEDVRVENINESGQF